MPTFDETDAVCEVIAYKDGVFSRVGHDVKLAASRLSVEVEPDRIVVVVDARSLVPVCAVRDGREDRAVLSARDLETIRGYVANDILAVERYPEIRYESGKVTLVGAVLAVEGTLTLRGRSRPLRARVERRAGRLVTRVTLRQPEYGIRPFTALLGGLRIKPDVAVELSVPLTEP